MVTLSQRLSNFPDAVTQFTLSLTAEERTRSRYRFVTQEGEPVTLNLPRGTILRDRDLLATDNNSVLVRVVAKPEPVLTVTADNALTLLRAAYHLGNRHVALEMSATYLRLSPDPVLQGMLTQLGVSVKAEIAPFQPEVGAYTHAHGH